MARPVSCRVDTLFLEATWYKEIELDISSQVADKCSIIISTANKIGLVVLAIQHYRVLFPAFCWFYTLTWNSHSILTLLGLQVIRQRFRYRDFQLFELYAMATSSALAFGSNDSLSSQPNGISNVCHCFIDNCVKHGESEVRTNNAGIYYQFWPGFLLSQRQWAGL